MYCHNVMLRYNNEIIIVDNQFIFDKHSFKHSFTISPLFFQFTGLNLWKSIMVTIILCWVLYTRDNLQHLTPSMFFVFYITVCFCSSCKSNTLSMFSVNLRLQSVNVVSLSFLLDQLTLVLLFWQWLWIFDDGLRDLRVTWISTVFFFLTLYLLPSPNFVICYIGLKGNLIDNFMFIFWIFYIFIYFITLISHKVVTKL